MLIHFIIIGAPRSGTDFLFYNIGKHPEVCISKKREIHFFDRNYKKGVKWYSSFFDGCSPTSIVGEKTANYLAEQNVAKRIFQTFPNVKLIVILRNPVDRAYSHYWNWVRLRKISPDFDFMKCCESCPEILDMGFYYKHIMKYLEYFEKKQILFMFYDDLIDNSVLEYKKMCEFLNISKNYIPKDFTEPLNYSGIPQNNLKFIIKNHLNPFKEILKPFFPESMMSFFRKESLNKYPKMQKVERDKLIDLYEKDVLSLFDFTGRCLPEWLKKE